MTQTQARPTAATSAAVVAGRGSAGPVGGLTQDPVAVPGALSPDDARADRYAVALYVVLAAVALGIVAGAAGLLASGFDPRLCLGGAAFLLLDLGASAVWSTVTLRRRRGPR